MPSGVIRHPTTGQLFMIAPNIAPNHPGLGVSYLLNPYMPTHPQTIQHSITQHLNLQQNQILAQHPIPAPQPHQLHHPQQQLALPPPPPPQQQQQQQQSQPQQLQYQQQQQQQQQHQQQQHHHQQQQHTKQQQQQQKQHHPHTPVHHHTQQQQQQQQQRSVNKNNSNHNNHNNNNNNHEGLMVKKKPQSIEQTNAKILGKLNIKEKCLSHYIDGQLIIETSKPLTEKKLKSSKKKKLQKQSTATTTPRATNQIAATPTHTPTQTPTQIKSNATTPVAPTTRIVPLPTLATTPATTSNHQASAPKPTQTLQNDSASEINRLRAEMPSWSVSDVVKFIEKHEDIRQYSPKFAEDEMDGKALLLMIDRNLNFQILTSMFKHGPAMKIEATLSKYKLND